MKILRITTSLDFGGIEKVFELHAKYSRKQNELIFVALGKGGNIEKVLKDLGYKVIVLNIASARIPSTKVIGALVKLFKQEKPDVIHAAGAEANFHATVAARFTGNKRIICEEIGIPNHTKKAKLVFRFVYLFARKVIAISKAVEEFLVQSKEVPANKVELIYNPINEIDSKDGAYAKEKLLFSIVARLEPVKNVALLIEAFAEIVKLAPEANLVIIGDGSQGEELKKQVERLQISNCVTFKGFLANPHPELQKSSFFVLPSLFEGFGLACIEAIQAGNVVICTDSGGIPEFINDGEQGFLFSPKNKESLVTAIRRAIALTENDKNEMVKSAQERVGQMFSPRKYVRQLDELYHSVSLV